MRHWTWWDIRLPYLRHTRNEKTSLRVQAPKKKEREVPVPASLIAALKKYIASKKPNADGLVFPNESRRPDKRHDFKLQRIAFHAKLNCGQCVSKHGNEWSEGPFCSNFFLHKFRHTFGDASRCGLHRRRLRQGDGGKAMG
jgi:integrase/recombinase XerD